MDRPSRPDTIRIRDARLDEIEALSALCLRSKAHWGYDAAFIAACAPYLRLEPELVGAGHAFVAEDASGAILGVCQVAPGGKSGSLDLLFIEPAAIGRGVGRSLFEDAKCRLKACGETTMTILSDPDAKPFYERMGARFVKDRPSDVFEGRTLPWLEYDLS